MRLYVVAASHPCTRRGGRCASRACTSSPPPIRATRSRRPCASRASPTTASSCRRHSSSPGSAGARCGPGHRQRLARPNVLAERLLLGIDDARIDAWLDALPAGLDRIDGWIGGGVLGDTAAVNAADLQIGSSLAALRTSEDLRPLIEARPANRLADLFPEYPRRMPAGTIRVPAGAPV